MSIFINSKLLIRYLMKIRKKRRAHCLTYR